jgi:tetratricopeptide (TPR) repeat protein
MSSRQGFDVVASDQTVHNLCHSSISCSQTKGNAAFTSGKFKEGIEWFSAAIEVDGRNHVLFSNRSACYASLKDWPAALKDAEQCVSLKDDWAKGYSRLGAAHMGLEDFEKAVKAYTKGLALDPDNSTTKTSLAEAKKEEELWSDLPALIPIPDKHSCKVSTSDT